MNLRACCSPQQDRAGQYLGTSSSGCYSGKQALLLPPVNNRSPRSLSRGRRIKILGPSATESRPQRRLGLLEATRTDTKAETTLGGRTDCMICN